ncbi:UDP-glucose 4-epimerase GalE [Maricaulis sp. D1M11]|uniref:UDP-glucose 4-epimerase GalE n=1 Tax=Maricaulis sp. D1M11 TaxID=3076117 RepID=UPI0039B5786A
MKRVLVTGGAGYVGSHACLKLAEAGYMPITYDNLSTGHREFVRFGPFEEGDVRDRQRLAEVMNCYRPEAVMHFAAQADVAASMRNPEETLGINLGGTACVADMAAECGADAFILSSTCAVYGNSGSGGALTEETSIAPESPYGESKYMAECVLAAQESKTGMRTARLRYFNAAGADPEGRIGESHYPETHLIPLALKTAQGRRGPLKIFGTDYDTPDGTAIRDYVHVLDLADAHIAALEHLWAGGQSLVANLGTGQGTSVREIIQTCHEVTGERILALASERRRGDPAALYADASRAFDVLNWKPRHELIDMIAHAWAWHNTHEAQILRETRSAAE